MITHTPPPAVARPTPESDEFFLLAYGEPLSANAKLDRKFSRTIERQRDEAREERDALRVALEKERAAVAKFLVPWKHHLPECWIENFVESGSVYFDEIGYVKASPIHPKEGGE